MSETTSIRSRRLSFAVPSLNSIYKGMWINPGDGGSLANRRRSSVSHFRAKDLIITDYSSVKDYEKIHKHDHTVNPHVHDWENVRCLSSVSGIDSHRDKRYYFTNEKTPVRAYVVYGGPALAFSAFVDETQDGHQRSYGKSKFEMLNNNENERLTLAQLKKLNLSKKFQQEALKMVYCSESKSFIPMPSAIRSCSSRAKSRTPINTL